MLVEAEQISRRIMRNYDSLGGWLLHPSTGLLLVPLLPYVLATTTLRSPWRRDLCVPSTWHLQSYIQWVLQVVLEFK